MHYSIIATGPNTATLAYQNNHTGTTLPLPVSAEDLKALIGAAFKAPDSSPRVELHGVLADKMSDGVRLRQVAQTSWFDIPWSIIAQDAITLKES